MKYRFHHISTGETNTGHEKNTEALFGEIFRKYEYRLFALALRHTKSEQHAKDVIQEVFLRLWEYRDQLGTIRNPEAWLYRLTENKVIDFLRKAAADGRLKEAIWQQMPLSREEEIPAETREYGHIIQQAIDRLPPQRKLIYQLNREKGLNYQEIASQLSLSRHTVKNQLSTALQSIRHFLSGMTRCW